MRCVKCKEKAVYHRRYSGQMLCKEHFLEYFERKVRKNIRKIGIKRGDSIGIGLSGGKDSMSTLQMLWKSSKKIGFELTCIGVDEGIDGYREETLAVAKAFTGELDVPFEVVSFKETYGRTLDEMADNGNACTYCGVLRRRLLNEKARKLGMDKLATGHNLDDEVQAVMMNYLRGDVERLIRLGNPISGDGFVGRIKPLSEMPEKEVALYSLLTNLGSSSSECPYSQSFRSTTRDFINQLEKANPGIKFSVMRGYEKLSPHLKSYSRSELLKCSNCGEPSSQEVCNACKILKTLSKK
ncbi:MAG: TIGR00269 family protein [Candidatus Hydrothermarchaeales archaeon]